MNFFLSITLGCLFLPGQVVSEVSTQCEGKTDILLIIDASGSIGRDNFEIVRHFIANLTSNFRVGSDTVRFSELVFSTINHDVFSFTAYLSNAALKEAIRNTTYYSGSTNTGGALKQARTFSFTSANGARPDVPKIAIVLTDGLSDNRTDTSKEAALLKQSGVTVMAIGVGSGVAQSELLAIATSPQHVYNVTNFNTLDTIRQGVAYSACEESVKQCEGKADVLLVIDASGSIGINNFDAVRQFIASLTLNFKVDRDAFHFSELVFSNSNHAEFGFNAYLTNAAVAQALRNTFYYSGETYTGAALRYVRSYSFATSNEARPDIPKIAIVLTYGKANDGADTIREAALLKQSGVTVLVIGVGSAVDRTELLAIATSPKLVFNVANFSALSTVRNNVTLSACESLGQVQNPGCVQSSCNGLQDGDYPSCGVECQEGYYYSCARQNATKRECPLGWYVDANNHSCTARMVYDPSTKTCQLKSDSCARNTTRYCSVRIPQALTVVASKSRYIQCITNCTGRPDGEYAACSPVCQDGVFYSCVAGNTSMMLCDVGSYVNKDGILDSQRKVYDPSTGTCNLTSPYCVRNSSVGAATSLKIAPLTEVTTVTVTNATIVIESQCKRKSDILFIVDASGSIGDANFETMRQFIADLTSKFVVNQELVRFSELVFSTSCHNEFGFNAYTTNAALHEALLRTSYYSGMTFLGPALKQARTFSFTSGNGGRPDAAKIAVILTDGQFNDINCTRKESELLKQYGVTVLSIGVGPDVEISDLLLTATTSRHMFNVCDFDSLKNITTIVARAACEENNLFQCVQKTCEGFPDGDYPPCEAERDGALYYTCYNDKKLMKVCSENRVFKPETKKCEAKY